MEDKDFLNTLENWNNKVLNEHDLIADSRELINQLNTAFPFLASRSLVVNNDLVSSTGDWNDLQGNTVYAYKSLNGKNAPDSQKLGTNSGIVLTLQTQDRTLTNQLVIPTGSTELSLAYRSNMGTLVGSIWSYLTPSELYSNLLKSDNVFTGVNKYMTPPQDKDGNAFITAQNVSQLDPTIVHGKDLTGVANLLSIKDSMDGYLTNTGNFVNTGLNYNEKTSDYIGIDNIFPYNLNIYLTVPNGNASWVALSLFDKDKKFIGRFVPTADNQDADIFVNATYWLLPKGDTSKVPTYNFTDETQYVRISWRNYSDDTKIMFTRGYYPQDYVPSLNDLGNDNTIVHKSDILGGRNYIDNSSNIIVDGDTEHYKVLYTGLSLGYWTISFDAKYISGTDTSVYLTTQNKDINNQFKIYNANIVDGKIKYTFHVDSDEEVNLLVYATGILNSGSLAPYNTTAGKKLQIDDVMLEKGEVQHDWVPSPDDFPSAVDPSVSKGKVLTASDDILALDTGTYGVRVTAPKNYPTSTTYGIVVVKQISEQSKMVEVLDTSNNHLVNIYSGSPITWSGWQVPNSDTMATKSDVQVAVNTATADMMKTTDWVYHSSSDDAETAAGNDNLFHYSDD